MRIFERLSRRLAITLAGVMACSSFAVAPAMTVFAAENDVLSKEEIATLQSNKIDLQNEADYLADVELESGLPKAKAYKIHSDVEGKLILDVYTKAKADIHLAFWKDGDTTAKLEGVSVELDQITEKTFDVKAGDYYVCLNNPNTDAIKYQIKAAIKTNYKSSKVGKIESPAKKVAKVTIKKVKKVDGYEIQASTSKDFDKNVKTKSFKAKKIKFDKKNGTVEIKKLKSGKKYYVRVRTYVKENGVKYYSNWSDYKKIKKVK